MMISAGLCWWSEVLRPGRWRHASTHQMSTGVQMLIHNHHILTGVKAHRIPSRAEGKRCGGGQKFLAAMVTSGDRIIKLNGWVNVASQSLFINALFIVLSFISAFHASLWSFCAVALYCLTAHFTWGRRKMFLIRLRSLGFWIMWAELNGDSYFWFYLFSRDNARHINCHRHG